VLLALLLAAPPSARAQAADDQLPAPPPGGWGPAPLPPEGALVGGNAAPGQPDKPTPPPRWWERALDRIAFHGYARIPLSVKLGEGKSDTPGAGGGGPRSPYLVDDDYYLSGFAYTRLHEKDWTELFLSYNSEQVSVEVGMFASLLADWSKFRTDQQWGLAQASISWQRRFSGRVLKRLLVRGGVFWNRFGFIEPYDTYVFGRTHQGGLLLQAELPWVELSFGMGAHLALPEENQGLTPLFYGSLVVRPPSRRWEAGFYWLHELMEDKPPLSNREDASMTVLGLQVRAMIPYLRGPLTIIPWAYYKMENAIFLGPAIELLHSSSSRQLMQNYLGDPEGSKNGDGSFPIVAAIDFPARLWKGMARWPVMNGPLTLRLFGLVAYVRSPQDFPDDPSKNRNKRTYLKWGVEPGLGIFPWLRFSVRYDRVILDMYDAENSFRAVSLKLSFQPFRWGEIFAMLSKYSYGSKVALRAGQVTGGITLPDDLVFKLQAQAVW
jgi:hypothetical protein